MLEGVQQRAIEVMKDLEHLSCGGRTLRGKNAQGDLLSVYKYLMGRSKEDRA